MRHLLGILEAEAVGRVCVHGRDGLHALQGLDPALGLLRLAGFGAEPVDEVLHVLDLGLLSGMPCLLLR